ncbi:DUF6207 family protein [Streptomyces sp. NPDC051366]|uniref:DUF6207 family protein n=1 Tax=Streptomyces sp. NPDC051366 TaxID=3365652 RepID=UPI0037A7BA2A
MKPVDEQHTAEPGLVVLDITGGDEDTVQAVMAALKERWATSGLVPVRQDPGEPGVGPGSTPMSCARGGSTRSRKPGQAVAGGVPRVALGLPRRSGLSGGRLPQRAGTADAVAVEAWAARWYCRQSALVTGPRPRTPDRRGLRRT